MGGKRVKSHKSIFLFCGLFTLLSAPGFILSPKKEVGQAQLVFPQKGRRLASVVQPASHQCEPASRWRYRCSKKEPRPSSCVKDRKEIYLNCKSL